MTKGIVEIRVEYGERVSPRGDCEVWEELLDNYSSDCLV